jgi:6-phosphogluconate dehydrogenase
MPSGKPLGEPTYREKTQMQLGVIGLGRMGGNIVRRLARNGHRCVVFDQNAAAIKALVGGQVTGGADLKQLVGQLDKPRAVWVMLPAGEITENAVTQLAALLDEGDTIIDGGNSFYKDDIRRAKALRPKGIHYVDCGTSGGVWGLDRGYCLMIGGDKEVVDRLDPIFDSLAPGAGRFVKMVHNGIEYGLMQAYAEGFDILGGAASEELPQDQRYQLDLPDIAEVWRRGSVIGSWLLDLTAMALAEDPKLKRYSGFVEDSGEGRWTIMAAIDEAVPADVLSAALYARFRSRENDSFSDKLLSAMRNKFGGHVEPKADIGADR